MQEVTLTVALLGSLCVLFLRPAYAFASYIIVLFVYPVFLVVQIGSFDITAARIIVAVLLGRCAIDHRIRKNFRWNNVDTWVTFYMLVALLIPVVAWHLPMLRVLENRSGFLMDSYCAYLSGRFCISSRSGFISIVKCVGVVLIPLACLGILESCAGWQPFLGMEQYCPWVINREVAPNVRLGFYKGS